MTTTQELPELVGSEKQRNWAEGLRAKYVAGMISAQESYARTKYLEEVDHRHYAMEQRWYALTLSITSASWWIDYRYDLSLLPPEMLPGKEVRRCNNVRYHEYDGILYTTTSVRVVERLGRDSLDGFGGKALRLVTVDELLAYKGAE